MPVRSQCSRLITDAFYRAPALLEEAEEGNH
jgi:hypothetical protein